MTKLTEAAKKICEDNYTSNCSRCPLRPQCVRNCGVGRDAYERWLSEVNEAADLLMQK